MSRTAVNCLENGKYHTVSLESLQAVSSVFGISLRDLLARAEGNSLVPLKRGREGEGEFILDYPEAGLRIISWIPRRKDFFLGNLFLKANRQVSNGILPHTHLLFFEMVKGTMLITFPDREMVLKEKEYVFFDGRLDYELYNPHGIDEARAMITAFPSFL